jgi:hypothetical protein
MQWSKVVALLDDHSNYRLKLQWKSAPAGQCGTQWLIANPIAPIIRQQSATPVLNDRSVCGWQERFCGI